MILPVDPDGELPAHGRLPVDGRLAGFDGTDVERTPGPSGEAGPVEEHAGAVDHPGVRAPAVGEDAGGAVLDELAVELPLIGVEDRRVRGDVERFGAALGAVAEVSPVRTASLAEFAGALGKDALAPGPVDAGPVRLEEGRVEPPGHVARPDLDAPVGRPVAHERDGTRGRVRPVRAAVMQNWELRIDDVDDPVPSAGQVLARVLACGICGSDLHMLRFGAELRALMADVGQADPDAPDDPLRPQTFEPEAGCVMGHEFCCEVVDLGPGVDRLRVGDRVVSLPAAFDAAGVHAVGYSNRYPGGYGELMVLNQDLAIAVDAAVTSRVAALTEPMAVGVHAVNRSGIEIGQAAIVLGLGPVGLACVAELKRRGVGPVVGADFSPARRSLAEHFGCDEVVDPTHEAAISAWRRVDGTKPLVIFEAVGMPGMIDQAMRIAPRDSRIVVVGVCMPQDHLVPMLGIGRELTILFVLGYTPEEFAETHRIITSGAWDLEPLITGSVGIDAVPEAFELLGRPDQHAKIIVEPT